MPRPHGQQNHGQHQPKKAKRKGQASSTDYISQPLTQGQIRRQAKRTARLQTQPAKRQIKAEQRASALRERQIGDWFNQYGADVAKAGQLVDAAYGTADASIAKTGQNVANYAEQLRQRLHDEGVSDAQLREANYDPSQDSTAAQATLSRLDSSALLQGVNAADRASAADLYANKGTIAKREKIKQKLDEAARGRSLNQDLRDLATKKGDLTKQALSDLTQQERNFYLGQQAAQLNARGQRLDAKQARRDSRQQARADRIRAQLQAQSQAETRRHNLASEQNTARGHQITAQQNRHNRRQDRYERHHPNAGSSHDNPHAPDNQDVNQAMALLRTTPQKWFAGKTRDQIIDALITKDQTISRKEAGIAYDRFVRQQRQAASGF